MNILWLSHFIPYPPKGGMLSRSYNLLREASKYNNIYLLALIQETPLRTMFGSVDEGINEARRHLSDYCTHIEFHPMPSERTRLGKYFVAAESLLSTASYSVNWLRSRNMQHAITEILDKKEIEAIHVDTIGLAPYIENITNLPMLLTHHNVESHMMLRRSESTRNWLKKTYYYLEGKKLERYERKICPRFVTNITCSTLDSDRLLKVCSGLHIEEIPNGVDMDYFTPNIRDVEPYSIIWVGGLNWYPNLAAMQFFVDEVWPLLKSKYDNIVLDIVGQDPPPEFMKLSENDDSFRVHGFVDDVRPYISKAAVYVCPISDGGGTKLKVLDALAMEKALVANPISCEGIDVVDGETVLYATRPEEFVDSIARVFEDDGLRISMGQQGRQLVNDRYSYTSIGKRLSALYSSACGAENN